MKIIKSETLYKGKIFNLLRDTLSHKGHNFIREYVFYPGAVTILPFDGENIYFVEQYRHPAGKKLLELPAGKLEKNEDPVKCAQRELQEEVGFFPYKLTLIAKFYTAPGYSTEYMYLYLAEDLRKSKLPEDKDEFLNVIKLPVKDAHRMLKEGKMEDAKTIIGLLYFFSFRLYNGYS